MKILDTIGAVAAIINVFMAVSMGDVFAFLGWLVAAIYYVPGVIAKHYLP